MNARTPVSDSTIDRLREISHWVSSVLDLDNLLENHVEIGILGNARDFLEPLHDPIIKRLVHPRGAAQDRKVRAPPLAPFPCDFCFWKRSSTRTQDKKVSGLEM